MIARRPPSAKIAATLAPVAVPLTKAEQAMLLSFRATDDTGREHIAIIAKTIAENHPGRPRPLLQLIEGGAT